MHDYTRTVVEGTLYNMQWQVWGGTWQQHSTATFPGTFYSCPAFNELWWRYLNAGHAALCEQLFFFFLIFLPWIEPQMNMRIRTIILSHVCGDYMRRVLDCNWIYYTRTLKYNWVSPDSLSLITHNWVSHSNSAITVTTLLASLANTILVTVCVWVNELQPTISRSVCLGVDPHLGLTTRY
jgi:hypothetical protein